MRAPHSDRGPSPAGRLLRRFVAGQRGAVAIEFAFLMLPFLMLIFAVLEIAMLFLVAASLDTAMEGAARKVRTGAFETQFKTATPAQRQAGFEALICGQVTWLLGNCTDHLEVDIRDLGAGDNFTPMHALADPYNGTTKTFNSAATQVDLPPAKNIVVVRAWYKWPLISPLLGHAVQKLQNNTALIGSSKAFRNEPY